MVFKRKKQKRKIKEVVEMVKRRKARKSYFGKKRGRSHSSGSSSTKPMNVLLYGGLYGAVRSKLSNALTPITSKIPLGNIADEALLFTGAYLLRKNKMFGKVALPAMYIESARIGEAIISGQVGLGGSSSSNMGNTTFI